MAKLAEIKEAKKRGITGVLGYCLIFVFPEKKNQSSFEIHFTEEV